jgi:hypothetical protein
MTPRSNPAPGYGRLAAACAALVLLDACGSVASPPPDPKIEVKTIDTPVAVQCRPDLGPEPAYPDTDAALRAAPDLFHRVQRLVAGRLMRIGRDAQKTAALAQCAG